jgi:hypothetical protein
MDRLFEAVLALARVADLAREMSGADTAVIVRPGPDEDLRVDLAVGPGADRISGLAIPPGGSLAGLASIPGRFNSARTLPSILVLTAGASISRAALC